MINKIFIKKEAKANIDSIYFYGDSITYGMNATSTNDYVSKICAYFNVVKNNLAISGTHLENTYSGDVDNFRDKCNTVVPSKGTMKSLLIIAYGTNDGRGSGGIYYNPETYYTQFQECLNIIYGKGWKKKDIIIISPFYTKNIDLSTYGATRWGYAAFVQKAKAIANFNKITYYDAYSTMIGYGGDTLIDTDNVHPTNAGHTVVFSGLRDLLKTKINVKI